MHNSHYVMFNVEVKLLQICLEMRMNTLPIIDHANMNSTVRYHVLLDHLTSANTKRVNL